ncbi:MAG: hypothetical protein RLP44_29745 [Aggregatilineales bacterium]
MHLYQVLEMHIVQSPANRVPVHLTLSRDEFFEITPGSTRATPSMP